MSANAHKKTWIRRAVEASPLVIVDGVSLYPLSGAEEDSSGEGNSEGDAGADDDGSDESEDADASDVDDESDDDDDSDDDGKPKKRARLSRAERLKRQLAASKAEAEELRKYKAKKEREGLSDAEKLQAENGDLKSTNETLTSDNRKLRIELAILKESTNPKNKVKWKDVDDVLTAIARDDVDIDDDGTVHGIDDALKALAKRKPHWVETAGNNGGAPGGSSGGRFNNGGGNKDKETQRTKVVSKWKLPR